MNLTMKLASLAAMGIAGLVAPRVTSMGWKKVTGGEPPSDEPGESKFVPVVVFAAVSAIVWAVVQQLTLRGASRVVAKFEGPQDKA